MNAERERVRFLTDEDFNGHIVAGLRRLLPAIDLATADEAGTRGLPDPAVLAFAATQGRVLVSHDLRTMRGHFDTFVAGGQESPGLALIAQSLPIQRAIEALLLLWEASLPAEWRNRRIHLPL